MMQQEAYAKWLEGLRNPTVPQTTHALADYADDDTDGTGPVKAVCALGMACVANDLRPTYRNGVLLLGIPTGLQTTVERWNDTDGLTFAEIADKLEAYNAKYPFVGEES